MTSQRAVRPSSLAAVAGRGVSRWRARVLLVGAVLFAVVGVSPAPLLAPPALAAVSANSAVDPTVPPADNPTAYQACATANYLLPPKGPAPAPEGAVLAGYTNAAKIGESTVVGYPDFGYVSSMGSSEGLKEPSGAASATDPEGDTDAFSCSRLTAQLDYQGQRELPPFRATFASFGFEPVTATVHLQQAGPLEVADCQEPDGTTSPACPPVTTYTAQCLTGCKNPSERQGDYWVFSSAELTMRLSNVIVDGAPLDVGDSCRTDGDLTSPGSPITPDQVALYGGNIATASPGPVDNNILLTGGALTGMVTIPAFTGCGSGGEDLNPLVTAAVSGGGNQVHMFEGKLGLCPSANCHPPYYTVSGGGTFSGQAPFQLNNLKSGSSVFTINCPPSSVTVSLPDLDGPPRSDEGTLSWSAMNGCTGSNGSTWTIRQQGTAGIDFGTEDANDVGNGGQVSSISLALQGSGPGTGVPAGGPPCTVILNGSTPLHYTNPPDAKLAFGAGTPTADFGAVLNVRGSTCPAVTTIDAPTLSPETLPANFGALTITAPPAVTS